jgi:hypothetical protein
MGSIRAIRGELSLYGAAVGWRVGFYRRAFATFQSDDENYASQRGIRRCVGGPIHARVFDELNFFIFGMMLLLALKNIRKLTGR